MTTRLLLDADVCCYAAALGCQHPAPFDEDPDLLHDMVDLREARQAFDTEVQTMLSYVEGDAFTLVLSSKTNWRKDILPTYKGNRVSRRPLAWQHLRDYAVEEYGALIWENLEGDDVLGILATEPTDERRIIISLDKDFLTIPGEFYRTGEGRLYHQSPADARRYHLGQALTGDRVDGYTGCPKIGPKGAEKILDADCSWAAVRAAYEKAGLDEAFALTQARVAYILHHDHYNRETGEIKLWTPELS